MKQLLKINIILVSLISTAFAQEMGMSSCILRAQANNLRIKQAALTVWQTDLQYKQAQRNWQPTASGDNSALYSQGFAINPATNSVSNQGQWSANFGASGSLLLLGGGQVRNSEIQSGLNVDAAKQDLAQINNDIALQVAQAYMNALFAEELLVNSRIQIQSTQKQLERTEKLIKAGASPEAAKYPLEAQIAAEEKNIVDGENQVSMAYLSLKQLMNVSPDSSFKIVRPDIQSFEPQPVEVNTEIFASAEGAQPAVRAAQIRIRSAMIQTALADAARKPTLSAFAQINTRLSSLAQRPTDSVYFSESPILFNGQVATVGFPNFVYEKTPFFTQLSRNFGSSFGLSLNIPIYSRKQNITNMQLAEVGVQNAKLNDEIQRQTLRQSIEQAYTSLKAAYSSYLASQKQLKSAEVSFANAEKQIGFGTMNALDFTLAKNALSTAQNQVLRAKYEYIFREKILEFYEGKSLDLK